MLLLTVILVRFIGHRHDPVIKLVIIIHRFSDILDELIVCAGKIELSKISVCVSLRTVIVRVKTSSGSPFMCV